MSSSSGAFLAHLVVELLRRTRYYLPLSPAAVPVYILGDDREMEAIHVHQLVYSGDPNLPPHTQ